MKRPTSGAAGQGLVEYALILALVVAIAVVAVIFFGPQLAWALSTVEPMTGLDAHAERSVSGGIRAAVSKRRTRRARNWRHDEEAETGFP